MTVYYRWSDNDHRWGRFIYAANGSYRSLGFALTSSGDEDDQPFSTLRISAFRRTLIIILPPLIKAAREWVDTSRHQWSNGPGSGYWDIHRREYSFSFAEGTLHVHYGAQTHDSTTDKSKCYFLPWRQWRHVRRSFYDLTGEHFATFPERSGRAKLGKTAWRNQLDVERAIEGGCPTIAFEFDDFDGERITATTKIEEREWRFGEGKFKWLSVFRRPRIRRSLDINFSAETGRRKGSWKGGTIGTGIDMLPGELHEAAFRRYCAQHGMKFIGCAAQGIEARSDETRGGSAVGESPVLEEHAPKDPRQ